jgi:NhaP-type Na+/H+ or K+/H+ antiporter
MGNVLSTVALVVILFESGITLDPQIIPKIWNSTLRLTLTTFAVTIGITTLVGVHWLHLSPIMASMMGSTLGGTSAAVVIALVKSMKMKDPAGTILIMESALGDVLSIVLLLGLLEGATSGQVSPVKIFGSIFASLICAGIVGVVGGVIWLSLVDVVRRSPNTAFTTLAFVFILYGITDLMGFSGAIAALSFGVTLTNHEWMRLKKIHFLADKEFGTIPEFDKAFYYEVLFLLKVFFFIYLGVSIRLGDWWLAGIATVLILLIYSTRLIIVKWVTRVEPVTWDEASLMSALAPKGLVSAVLASIPVTQKIPGADQAQEFTYLVVIISILLSAILVPLATRKPMARFYQGLYGGREPKALPATEVE